MFLKKHIIVLVFFAIVSISCASVDSFLDGIYEAAYGRDDKAFEGQQKNIKLEGS